MAGSRREDGRHGGGVRRPERGAGLAVLAALLLVGDGGADTAAQLALRGFKHARCADAGEPWDGRDQGTVGAGSSSRLTAGRGGRFPGSAAVVARHSARGPAPGRSPLRGRAGRRAPCRGALPSRRWLEAADDLLPRVLGSWPIAASSGRAGLTGLVVACGGGGGRRGNGPTSQPPEPGHRPGGGITVARPNRAGWQSADRRRGGAWSRLGAAGDLRTLDLAGARHRGGRGRGRPPAARARAAELGARKQAAAGAPPRGGWRRAHDVARAAGRSRRGGRRRVVLLAAATAEAAAAAAARGPGRCAGVGAWPRRVARPRPAPRLRAPAEGPRDRRLNGSVALRPGSTRSSPTGRLLLGADEPEGLLPTSATSSRNVRRTEIRAMLIDIHYGEPDPGRDLVRTD